MSNPYLTPRYLNKRRWISYWHQIDEASALKNIHSILEVGPGNKIVADTLAKMGYAIQTLDNDPRSQPDFIGQIEKVKTLPDQKFDLVLASEVLEHIPYAEFPSALRNLRRLTKKYLLLTLPYTSRGTFKPYFHAHLWPFHKPISWSKIFNLFPRPHIFNNQHYWEIGKRGYPLKKVLQTIRNNNFTIIKHYPIPENLYHYLILCKR
ncbi:MAG: methyltransferase domain-containing protein [bacterium]|nr:methyltransferase domain-containing protein [bacterium]